MGVVYLAQDTRLDRTVALKALPEEVARDPERLARFEREAKLLASLNHPNIGAIYDVAESEGRRYLALEHIDGESLAQRLSRAALSVSEAIEVCLQIASGLEAGHERGVIHRDLKPQNVMITPDDQVKIVDFGLAKGAIAASATIDAPGGTVPTGVAPSSPTMTSPVWSHATVSGVILGTAPYLSPEQARGKPVDRRTDIWSWGCILYECLTGTLAFHGETVSDTVAAILRQEPDWSLLPSDLPSRVRDLLRRCLEKDSKKRLRDIGEAWIVLEEARAGSPNAFREPAAPTSTRWGRRFTGYALALALVALGAGYLWGTRAHSPAVSKSSPLHASISLPRDLRLDVPNGALAISPDGSTLALTGGSGGGPPQLWLRAVGGSELRPIPGTSGASHPFWSPDGRSLAFFADQKLKRIAIESGTIETICDAIGGRGGTWNREGTIVFAPAPVGGLYRVRASGGTPVPLTTLRGHGTHRLPQFLPDGKHLIYYSDAPQLRGICTLDLGSRKSTLLLEGSSNGIVVEPGYLLFLRDGNLLAQKWNRRTVKLEGDAVPLAAGVPLVGSRYTGPYTASASMLFYLRGDLNPIARLTRIDARGQVIDTMMTPGPYARVRVSVDGSHLAAALQNGRDLDLKIFDLTRKGDPGRTFRDIGGNFAWSPDGAELVYGHRSADPRGSERLNFIAMSRRSPRPPILMGEPSSPTYWSPDGAHILINRQTPRTSDDIWVCPVAEPRNARAVCATPASEGGGTFSPDGKWLVFLSDESGRREAYVTPFPGPGARWLVPSPTGVLGALWLLDGRTITFATSERQIMGVDVTVVDAEPRFGSPRLLFGGYRFRSGTISPDGKQFVDLIPMGDESPSITVLTNWSALLGHR